MRPLTIFSGQWTDMPLMTFAKKAASWGYEGIEVACGAHLDPVKAAKSKKYCKEILDTLKVNNLISCNKVHFRHSGQGNFAFADGHVGTHHGNESVFKDLGFKQYYTQSCANRPI